MREQQIERLLVALENIARALKVIGRWFNDGRDIPYYSLTKGGAA